MTTCGPLFRQAFAYAQEHSKDGLEFFSWGHLVGQAEKVYLGTCSALMVRPSNAQASRLLERVVIVCDIYSLENRIIETSRGPEYWIFRQDKWPLVSLLEKQPDTSKLAHFIRGTLCGVPTSELDLEFHQRYPAADTDEDECA